MPGIEQPAYLISVPSIHRMTKTITSKPARAGEFYRHTIELVYANLDCMLKESQERNLRLSGGELCLIDESRMEAMYLLDRALQGVKDFHSYPNFKLRRDAVVAGEKLKKAVIVEEEEENGYEVSLTDINFLTSQIDQNPAQIASFRSVINQAYGNLREMVYASLSRNERHPNGRLRLLSPARMVAMAQLSYVIGRTAHPEEYPNFEIWEKLAGEPMTPKPVPALENNEPHYAITLELIRSITQNIIRDSFPPGVSYREDIVLAYEDLDAMIHASIQVGSCYQDGRLRLLSVERMTAMERLARALEKTAEPWLYPGFKFRKGLIESWEKEDDLGHPKYKTLKKFPTKSRKNVVKNYQSFEELKNLGKRGAHSPEHYFKTKKAIGNLMEERGAGRPLDSIFKKYKTTDAFPKENISKSLTPIKTPFQIVPRPNLAWDWNVSLVRGEKTTHRECGGFLVAEAASNSHKQEDLPSALKLGRLHRRELPPYLRGALFCSRCGHKAGKRISRELQNGKDFRRDCRSFKDLGGRMAFCFVWDPPRRKAREAQEKGCRLAGCKDPNCQK